MTKQPSSDLRDSNLRSGEAPEPLTNRTIRHLWSKMVSIYGHRWVCNYSDFAEHPDGTLTDAGKVWAVGLAGITPKQVDAGITSALMGAYRWPPTLPEFRALALGVPTLARVQLVISKPDLQTEDVAAFCRLMWRFIDSHRLARADIGKATRMISDAYDYALEYRMNLGELPPPPAASITRQAPERPTRASAETAEAHADRIRQILGMHDPETTDEPTQTEATPNE
ncbi:hypothetical protein [Dyella sp.]|uniref:hypothetical protein n=1 Tax=Dyella sp. TaxID=1869338 RepID=UPI002FD8E973